MGLIIKNLFKNLASSPIKASSSNNLSFKNDFLKKILAIDKCIELYSSVKLTIFVL